MGTARIRLSVAPWRIAKKIFAGLPGSLARLPPRRVCYKGRELYCGRSSSWVGATSSEEGFGLSSCAKARRREEKNMIQIMLFSSAQADRPLAEMVPSVAIAGWAQTEACLSRFAGHFPRRLLRSIPYLAVLTQHMVRASRLHEI